MIYRKFVKRLFDFVLSLLAIIFLSPVLIVLAILIRAKLGSPIIFSQERIGKDEKVFRMHKFRTMTDQKDSEGNLLSDEMRVTPFGKKLRSLSLDELPELFDILVGNLSIVGPRPLVPEYIPYYTEHERKRHTVRGGLVPPEVLHKNIQPTWDEQLEYEADYAENLSFSLDMKIIFSTIGEIFHRDSVDYGSYVRQSLIEERKQKETVGANKK